MKGCVVKVRILALMFTFVVGLAGCWPGADTPSAPPIDDGGSGGDNSDGSGGGGGVIVGDNDAAELAGFEKTFGTETTSVFVSSSDGMDTRSYGQWRKDSAFGAPAASRAEIESVIAAGVSVGLRIAGPDGKQTATTPAGIVSWFPGDRMVVKTSGITGEPIETKYLRGGLEIDPATRVGEGANFVVYQKGSGQVLYWLLLHGDPDKPVPYFRIFGAADWMISNRSVAGKLEYGFFKRE
ncbi:MAG: hypothetical protein A3H59_02545 [Candidatus Jacksonbacteria bacterium RIFCSPLOWO2_02_FULL_43_9]|nr:MAG: hypothetical protein A2986_01655 [Candidatus Jacksonbacteria bacterium RIFCSPLOWO2_01_FULL_44_13]OGY73144.1 MAG: hypothetical protein A3H59_02545 [Candidatus Jacksonbacteria bacterium RIFCSPLOWO2_02_FULL_43_9]HAZ17067.1 hypothetical protein [Candidatus Jacksonbacteria bacterium]